MFASSFFEWRGEPFHAAQIIEMRLPVDGQPKFRWLDNKGFCGAPYFYNQIAITLSFMPVVTDALVWPAYSTFQMLCSKCADAKGGFCKYSVI